MPNEDKPKRIREIVTRFRQHGVSQAIEAMKRECPDAVMSGPIDCSGIIDATRYYVAFDPAKLGSERTVFADGTVHKHNVDGTITVEQNAWLADKRRRMTEESNAVVRELWPDPAPEYELDANGKVELDHKGNPVPRRKRKHEDR